MLGCSWFYDLLDALHDLVSQFWQHCDRLHVFCDLLHTSSTCDDRADAGVLSAPGQRQLQFTKSSQQCSVS